MSSRPHVFVRPPLALPGQRVGVMGGSFDPPHEGHLIVAQTALRRLQLDQLWWLVTPGNPLKSHDRLQSLEDRMAACRRMAGSDPAMHVTGFEAQLDSAFTAQTLEFLGRRMPGVAFCWVMGADNLAHVHFWQNWRGIARALPLAVIDRPDWRLRALASPAAQALRRYRVPETDAASLPGRRPPCWTFLTAKLSPLSSTELRQRSSQTVS